MSKILACITIALSILFAGLSPLYVWAVPLAIGTAIISAILIANGAADDRDDK